MDEQTQNQGISQNTIVVLVVLTLLISILGTWTVLSQINASAAPQSVSHNTGSGKVSLSIEQPAPPQVDSTTGHVVFEIQG